MIDDKLLSLLPDGACVVNVSRRPVLDTDAMTAHARIGRLRFLLDVFDTEPVPEDHPLRQVPNVLITPHVAGRVSQVRHGILRLVREQIERLLGGKPGVNVVIG